jgi:hypothetical protein
VTVVDPYFAGIFPGPLANRGGEVLAPDETEQEEEQDEDNGPA